MESEDVEIDSLKYLLALILLKSFHVLPAGCRYLVQKTFL
jgi:hypothetical protein